MTTSIIGHDDRWSNVAIARARPSHGATGSSGPRTFVAQVETEQQASKKLRENVGKQRKGNARKVQRSFRRERASGISPLLKNTPGKAR